MKIVSVAEMRSLEAAAIARGISGYRLMDQAARGAAEIVNAYAAEHTEIQTTNASEVAAQVRNAGAVFVGSFTPVSLGDYCAGSNHVLPTGGCACYSSGLSVHSFMRSVHVVNYDRAALQQVASVIRTLAHAEDLPAHAAAVDVRLAGPGGL